MSRIAVIEHHNANAEQKALLDAIQAQLGMVPNFLKVFANSPVALKAFLGLHGVANDGSLSAQTRERIALALMRAGRTEQAAARLTALSANAGDFLPYRVTQVELAMANNQPAAAPRKGQRRGRPFCSIQQAASAKSSGSQARKRFQTR